MSACRFAKNGPASACVARQYSGTLGKVGNCQIAVSVHAATDAASAVLDWRFSSRSPETRPACPTRTARSPICRLPAALPATERKVLGEYPFASRYQGASLNGGSARAHVGCAIPGVTVTGSGPRGHSVCMIDDKQSQKGGRVLQTFCSSQRLMRQDKFRVNAAP
ncbi:hypothetical protein Abr02nite_54740 [Paractinoplanes brasiliensis]|nr:hypothetical protein Abr02nite_54740 [Actinoplanes brasiliensis]